jgi:alginate O-acetyltransferase complex protein AlgJ
VLLGDSHVLVFHSGGDLHTAGAGLPDRLGAALGSSPDVLGVRGSGATSSRIALARRARADDAYLDAKQAVVWCFAGREFTESDGWKKVPLRKPGGG